MKDEKREKHELEKKKNRNGKKASTEKKTEKIRIKPMKKHIKCMYKIFEKYLLLHCFWLFGDIAEAYSSCFVNFY